MKKNLILLSIFIFAIFVLANCGIEPPTQDLEMAKSKISAADEVEADKFASDEYSEAKKLLVTGETNIVPEKDSQNKDAKEFLEQSQAKADAAYKKAAPKYASHYIDKSAEQEKEAKDIKADVAVKDKWTQAQKLYQESKDAQAKKDYKTAGKKAKEANVLFKEATDIATEKKTKADEAIQEAKKKLEEIQGN